MKALKPKDSPVFNFLQIIFPSLSNAKIKEGVFVGPQIRKLILDQEFDKMLKEDERVAWKCFKEICQKFLGSHRAENYEEVESNLLHSYEVLGCKMSLEVHFLASHLHFFHENLGDVSDEHGDRFYQDIAVIEKRYKGKWSVGMLADTVGQYSEIVLSRSISDTDTKSMSRSKLLCMQQCFENHACFVVHVW